ncbi:MAG: sigma-70 family RNA polymerase sigma factor [Pyrinomonadaceae bacterium]
MKTLVDVMSGQTAAVNDEIVFDEAFTLHHRTVFRASYSVLRDMAMAEDVTQETFIRLYKNLDKIDGQEMLKPWLIRVALNLSKNTLRGNSRANQREENYVKERGVTDEATAEKDLVSDETARSVNATLEKVREPHRSCLLLKHQGLSYREIAESLGISETSVGTYIARGKQEFIRHYGGIGGTR